MKNVRLIAAALLLGGLPAALPAGIANLAVNYQGQLTDNAGDPVNGPVNLGFQLFDVPTGGSAFWSTVETGVPAAQGLFNVELPMIINPASRLNGELWLEVTVNGQVMSPRKRLLAALYSYNADKLQGMDPGNGPGQIPVLDGTGKLDPSVVSSPFPLSLSGSAGGSLQALRALNFDLGANQWAARMAGASGLSVTAMTASGSGIWGMTAASDNASAIGVWGKAGSGVGVRAEANAAATTALQAVNPAGLGAYANGQWGLLVGGSAVGLRIGGAALGGQTAGTPDVGLEITSNQQGILVNNFGASPGVFSVNTTASGALHGRNTSASGVGVYGEHTGLGIGQGLRGTTASDQGVGVRGEALNAVATGSSIGVLGTAASAVGTGVSGIAPSLGVRGEANALVGQAYGVRGIASSSLGTGVKGESPSVGVWGEATGTGVGVQGTGLRMGGDFSSSDDLPAAYGLRASARRAAVYASAINTTGADAVGVEGRTASGDGVGVKGVVASLAAGAGKGVYGEALGPQGRGVQGYGGFYGIYGEAPGSGAGQTGVYGYVGGAGNNRYGMQAVATGAPGEQVYGLSAEVLGANNSGASLRGKNDSPTGYAFQAFNAVSKFSSSGYAAGVNGKLRVLSDNAGVRSVGPGTQWVVTCEYCGAGDAVIITSKDDLTQGGTVPVMLYVNPVSDGSFTLNASRLVAGFTFYYLVVDK